MPPSSDESKPEWLPYRPPLTNTPVDLITGCQNDGGFIGLLSFLYPGVRAAPLLAVSVASYTTLAAERST